MRRRAAIIALCLLTAGACARRRADGILDRIERNPEQLVSLVATLRELPNPRPARLHFHDERPFLALLHAREQLLPRGWTPGEAAPWQAALGLGANRGASWATAQQVRQEQVIAFYDADEHTIHIRRRRQASPEADEHAVWALAHEIGHSLQAQNLELPDLSQIQQHDPWLASMALIEGDAMLTTLAYVAHEQHVPLRRAVVHVRRAVEDGDFDQAIRLSGSSPELLRASPLLREAMLFPYAHGMSFVGAIHRAGGFGLVNRVYSHPPTSTEQILHPDKYLAGERPAQIPTPPAPAGHTRLSTGSLGELQIRVVLEQCLARPVARGAAAGWAGDAFSLLRSAKGSRAFVWSTAWDTAEDALEFERALRSSTECWAAAAGQRTPFGAEDLLQRDGQRVVLLRGIAGEQGFALITRVLAQPVSLPRAVPPLGPVRIPPVKVVQPTRPPYLEQGRYVDERLGIALPIPPGYSARLDLGLLVLLRRNGPPTTASVAVSELLVSAASVDRQFAAFETGFEQGGDGADLVVSDTGRVRTPLGEALARTWTVQGSDAQLRVVILPLCGGTGSVAFSQLWSDESGRAELDWWLAELRPLRPGPPPICAQLDP
jgi:hypothetical protein